MYPIHKEENSVVAERFIRILKHKTYRHIMSLSKNIYLDVLDDFVDKYKSTFRTTVICNLGGLFRGLFFFKLLFCLKLVRVMLETSNLACKYTHT